jgi:Tfp pilus assembly protein PilX
LVDAGNFWSASNPNISDVAMVDGGKTAPAAQQGIYSALAASACINPLTLETVPVWSHAFWNDGAATTTCADVSQNAVPTIVYGTFTGAPFAQQGVLPPRYLVEMFTADDFQIGGGSSNKLFFRITAVGFGRTTGSNGARTSVTLQSVFSAL